MQRPGSNQHDRSRLRAWLAQPDFPGNWYRSHGVDFIIKLRTKPQLEGGTQAPRPHPLGVFVTRSTAPAQPS